MMQPCHMDCSVLAAVAVAAASQVKDVLDRHGAPADLALMLREGQTPLGRGDYCCCANEPWTAGCILIAAEGCHLAHSTVGAA